MNELSGGINSMDDAILTGLEMIHFFIEPIPDGWVYPCTLEDIQHQLKLVPNEDVEGLWAIGLAPSTQKDCSTAGRYRSGEKPNRIGSKPTITIYSYPGTLSLRQFPHVGKAAIEHWQAIELEYGMVIRKEGSRWVNHWQAADLRRFVLENVLIHEIGHHVHYKQRRSEGLTTKVSRQVSEQFAEDYAVRWQRNRGLLRAR